MGSAFLTGWGSFLPDGWATSADLDAAHGLAEGTVAGASGIETRPLAGPHDDQVSMAAEAGRRALASARLTPDDLDLILFGGAVGYQPIPATAPFVKAALGVVSDAPAYDVNATCLGALVALDQAALQISAGRARRALVVASEIASRALPWHEAPEIAGLFGDGAGAWIVTDAPGGDRALEVGPLVLRTRAEGAEHCTLRSGGTRIDRKAEPEAFVAGATFAMDGRALYRLSTTAVPGVIDEALAHREWDRSSLDLVIPHQASPGALGWLERRCGFAEGVVWNEVGRTGNLVAASLPVALERALEARGTVAGDKVLLIGTSAGVSIGALTLAAL
ncbi:MAG: ketoacyl-ACP synthase III [Pseudomonadota bacterium]